MISEEPLELADDGESREEDEEGCLGDPLVSLAIPSTREGLASDPLGCVAPSKLSYFETRVETW